MEKPVKVLAVDDEEDILHIVKYNLTKELFDVYIAKNGIECLAKVAAHSPDIILLDVIMPGLHGVEVCKKLKSDERYKHIPIIMLTAKSTEKNIVDGLNIGADDYLTKPFSMKVLIARIKALMRRKSGNKSDFVKIGELEINLATREITLKGKKIEFTHSRFQILALLASNPNVAFSRKDIIRHIKGEDYPVTDRAVDVHIVELRKHLKEYGKYIKSVRGVGYKFKMD